MEVEKTLECVECQSKFCEECGDVKQKLCYDCLGWTEELDEDFIEEDLN